MNGIMSCPRQIGGCDSDRSDLAAKRAAQRGQRGFFSKRDLEPRLWKAASSAKQSLGYEFVPFRPLRLRQPRRRLSVFWRYPAAMPYWIWLAGVVILRCFPAVRAGYAIAAMTGGLKVT